jgi:glutathione S-transferase
MRRLYQFTFSHFCEKTRWALDYKGLDYECRNLLPGLHRRVTRKLAPRSSVPILTDDATIVQDSTAIISYLDSKYPARPLTPTEPGNAAEALAWEDYLGKQIGIPLRLWTYFHLLPDRERTLQLMLRGAPWYGRPYLSLMFPRIQARMTKVMNLQPEAARQAEASLLGAFDRLDTVLRKRRFLVGETFSRADLTACALLSPYCTPNRSEAEVSRAYPDVLCMHRERNQDRVFFRWVHDMYRSQRRCAA